MDEVAQFLKSFSGHDFSSDLKPDSVKRLVFGDKGIFSLVFWSTLADPNPVSHWVVIKEHNHVSRELDLVDLLKQFHPFGELTVHPHQNETIVGNHDTKTELVFSSSKGDFTYLRGTVCVRPFV